MTKASHLKAAAYAACKDKGRESIRCVRAEKGKFVATNGKVLIRTQGVEGPELSLDLEGVKQAIRANKPDTCLVATFRGPADCTVQAGPIALAPADSDVFPNYQSILDGLKTPTLQIKLSADQLDIIIKAAKALDQRGIEFSFRGPADCASFRFFDLDEYDRSDGDGMIMPIVKE